MGKYMRKGKGTGEVAVMELAQVGVSTRARALAMAVAAAAANSRAAKRRKVVGGANGGELRCTSRRRAMISAENSASPAISMNREVIVEDRCLSPSDCHVPPSCSSSNGSSERVKDNLKFIDLEDDEGVEVETSTYFDSRERKQTIPSSSEFPAVPDEMDSSARPSESNSCNRSTTAKKIMPSESEIEDFFAAAEKDMKKCFAEKYNYDIVKDVPLEGRYEWVRLKP